MKNLHIIEVRVVEPIRKRDSIICVNYNTISKEFQYVAKYRGSERDLIANYVDDDKKTLTEKRKWIEEFLKNAFELSEKGEGLSKQEMAEIITDEINKSDKLKVELIYFN